MTGLAAYGEGRSRSVSYSIFCRSGSTARSYEFDGFISDLACTGAGRPLKAASGEVVIKEIEQAMPSAEVRVSGPGGVSVVTRTDTFGNARFRLSAGRYVAHLVSADRCTAGTYDATVTVRPHQSVRTRVTCGNP